MSIVIDLRTRFADSLITAPDVIDFTAAVEDRRSELDGVLRSLGFMRAAGHVPGEGTAQELETIAAKLLQTASAWRVAKVLGHG
jgi:hypothetical protein